MMPKVAASMIICRSKWACNATYAGQNARRGSGRTRTAGELVFGNYGDIGYQVETNQLSKSCAISSLFPEFI